MGFKLMLFNIILFKKFFLFKFKIDSKNMN